MLIIIGLVILVMAEGSPKPSSCFSRDILPIPAVYASKNSGPYGCPRGYRGGTAAGVRSNTFILRACWLSRERTSRSKPRDHASFGWLSPARRMPRLTPPLDIRAATAYCLKWRSGSRRLHPGNTGHSAGPEFSYLGRRRNGAAAQ
jgi:hypothetical protein